MVYPLAERKGGREKERDKERVSEKEGKNKLNTEKELWEII